MNSDQNAASPPVMVALPFAGAWKVRNSPARRVPSHGSHILGTTYAIDFVGVDERGRTAPSVSWRTLLATEPPELFFAFGRPITAPIRGRVVAVHDAEEDHEARRSPLSLVPYMLGQGARLRQGLNAIAGNHVLISVPDGGVVVGLMHLKAGSIRVAVGQAVEVGDHIANCGNSGNSTQPHLHLQAMDGIDARSARGLPMSFKSFREKRAREGDFTLRHDAVPNEASVVEGP